MTRERLITVTPPPEAGIWDKHTGMIKVNYRQAGRDLIAYYKNENTLAFIVRGNELYCLPMSGSANFPKRQELVTALCNRHAEIDTFVYLYKKPDNVVIFDPEGCITERVYHSGTDYATLIPWNA